MDSLKLILGALAFGGMACLMAKCQDDADAAIKACLAEHNHPVVDSAALFPNVRCYDKPKDPR